MCLTRSSFDMLDYVCEFTELCLPSTGQRC